MLLDRQIEDDVEVLVLRGPVADADAPLLGAVVSDALQATHRGVVIDLTDTDVVADDAVSAMTTAAEQAGDWPRPSLAVCGAPEHLRGELASSLTVHEDRQGALANVDARPSSPAREVTVDHGPHGPRQARAAVQAWAEELGLHDLVDDLLLIVSELVTNAVRYGRPPVCVAATADDRTVTIGVVDAGSDLPLGRHADDDAESGRGLLLLSLLSAEHGVRRESPGKVVWACLQRD